MSQMPCVRGCKRPCVCPDCKAADVPAHEPQPAKATAGLLCTRCADRLWKWLDTVLDDTVTLDTRKPADYGWDKEGGHQKITGSPALVRLDVAALTDRRTAAGVANDPRSDSEHQPRNYPENRDPRAPVDIPGEVCSWARILTEEQGLSSPVDTMGRAVGVLTAWWETLILQLWVDDFYTGMAEIRGLLDMAHDVERPKPVGECFTCNKTLYSRPGCADLRCGQCGRKYDGWERVRVEVQRRREANA